MKRERESVVRDQKPQERKKAREKDREKDAVNVKATGCFGVEGRCRDD